MANIIPNNEILIPREFEQLIYGKQYRYFAIYGGRGSLKSHTVARALLIKASGEEQIRVLATRELQKSIKDSVLKLLADLIDMYNLTDFEVLRDIIRNKKNGSEFLFTGIKGNTNEIKSMEGIDYCWCEEAQSLTQESIDILTPTIRKKGSQIIFTYNRFNELDPIHKKLVLDKAPNTCVIKVNYPVAQKYGWFDEVLEKEMEHDRKNNPELYNHKWLGEPVSQADNAILDRATILNSMQHEIDADGEIFIGVDVARMGDDRTVIVKRKGLKTIDMAIFSKLRTNEVCDQIEILADWDKSVNIKVDDTGVGGGVTDEMMNRGYNVMGVNFGARANDSDKYPNWISEQWFTFKEILPQIQIPFNDELLMELSTRGWKQDIKGKRAVESKETYKKRGFRSPDIADALIIAFSSEGLDSDDDIAL